MRRITPFARPAALALAAWLGTGGPGPAQTGGGRPPDVPPVVAAARASLINLAQAIVTAESQADDGRATEATFREEANGAPALYRVTIRYPNGSGAIWRIDADRGLAIGRDILPVSEALPPGSRQPEPTMRDALIAVAQRMPLAKAFEARTIRDAGGQRVTVRVAWPDREDTVTVERGGRVIGRDGRPVEPPPLSAGR